MRGGGRLVPPGFIAGNSMDRVHVRDARRRERADAGFQEIVKDTIPYPVQLSPTNRSRNPLCSSMGIDYCVPSFNILSKTDELRK
jgi:hypothetical protein